MELAQISTGLLDVILGITKPTRKETEQAISSAVNGLSEFELQFVYHHIYEGRKLSLRAAYNKVDVYYRTHKLGVLPARTTQRILHLIEKGYNVLPVVTMVKKSTYSEIQDLEISIKISRKK